MMRPLTLAGFLVVGLSASSAIAQTTVAKATGTPPASPIVKTAHLKLMNAAKQVRLLAGRLYRVPLDGDQAHVADVSEKGELDQPYECSKGDRLLAVPVGSLYTGDNRTKPCRDAVEFEYETTYTVALQTRKPASSLKFGQYLNAYADLSSLYGNAADGATGAMKVEYLAKARATETAVFAATAMALGDDKLDKLVTRDPTQGYRLVLNKEGIAALRTLQRDYKLPVTGKLDFATLKLVGNFDTPDALKTASGEFIVLPNEWVLDDVIRTAPNKSTSLMELGAAAQKK